MPEVSQILAQRLSEATPPECKAHRKRRILKGCQPGDILSAPKPTAASPAGVPSDFPGEETRGAGFYRGPRGLSRK